MRSLIEFLKYNNLVPVVVGVVLLGAGAVIAASNPTVRQTFLQQAVPMTQEVGAPPVTDSQELLALDLGKFDPTVRIRAVTEDKESYRVEYSYQTYEVAAGKWRLLPKSGKLTVAKAFLKDRDLGLYVAEEIGEVVNRELAYLTEVQTMERAKLAAAKTKTTTQYAGLTGKSFDAKKGEIAGYDPVVTPEKTATKDEKEGGEEVQEETIVVETEAGTGQTVLSQEEIQAMILKAVSDFLAIETKRLEEETPAVESEPIGAAEATGEVADPTAGTGDDPNGEETLSAGMEANE